MAKFAALMLWTDAWVADTAHLSRCERGTYLDLLVLMWRTPGCSVPNDDDWLARHMRMTPTEVAEELRPIISEFCQTDGNRIWQKRLTKEFEWSRKQSARAKSRWKKEKDVCQSGGVVAHATVTVPVSVNPERKTKQTASVLGKEARQAARPNPMTSLPENWHSELAGTVEFERFCDNARAKAKLSADWEASWRNWNRNAPRFNGAQGNGHGRRSGSVLDAADRLIEKFGGQEAANSYVVGSSGPKPLSLDIPDGKTNIRQLPKR